MGAENSFKSRLNRNQHILLARKSAFAERKGARDALIKVRDAEIERENFHREEQRLSYQAHIFLLSEIAERRQDAIKSIEEIGTSALQMVYGEGHSLIINKFDEKKKEGVANFKMQLQVKSPFEGGELVTGLIGETGGGLIETISFSLRIAALLLKGYDGVLCLDEACKSMSHDEKIHAFAQFLRHIVNQTGMQLIFITHETEVFGEIADRIITLTKDQGTAQAQVEDGAYKDYEEEE